MSEKPQVPAKDIGHISQPVREALPKLGPEKSGRVCDVADRK